MPRRKITVEDALRVLEEAGIPLQAKPTDSMLAAQPTTLKAEKSTTVSTISQPMFASKLVKITLFAKHSVGSGGVMTDSSGEKQIEDAGVQSYGPGVCTVPSALASHLLHADSVARQADKDMLDREQKSYLVVQKRSPSGYLANVGILVDNEILDYGMGNIPRDYTHIIG